MPTTSGEMSMMKKVSIPDPKLLQQSLNKEICCSYIVIFILYPQSKMCILGSKETGWNLIKSSEMSESVIQYCYKWF